MAFQRNIASFFRLEMYAEKEFSMKNAAGRIS
jgi:hypothetical protein